MARSVFGRAPALAGDPDRAARSGVLRRIRIALSTGVAAVLGLLPHVLHHVGPLAGTALVAGFGGSLLFGAIGLVASIPFLVRMRRHYGSWKWPMAALGLFAIVFAIPTFVVGPALTGDKRAPVGPPSSSRTAPGSGTPAGHEAHHK
jgi:hypothetical protein